MMLSLRHQGTGDNEWHTVWHTKTSERAVEAVDAVYANANSLNSTRAR